MPTAKKRKYLRNYYTVMVPGDFTDDKQAVLDQAIMEARDRARLYCIPCEWTATIVSGEIGDYEITVRVCRKRLAK